MTALTRMRRWQIKLARGGWTLSSLNLKTLSGLQASFNDLCCSESQHEIELRLRLSPEDHQRMRRSTASP